MCVCYCLYAPASTVCISSCLCVELCQVLSTDHTQRGLIKLCADLTQNFDTHRELRVCIRNINAHINFVLTFCHPPAAYRSPNRQKLFLIPWSQGKKHTHLHACTLMKKKQPACATYYENTIRGTFTWTFSLTSLTVYLFLTSSSMLCKCIYLLVCIHIQMLMKKTVYCTLY